MKNFVVCLLGLCGANAFAELPAGLDTLSLPAGGKVVVERGTDSLPGHIELKDSSVRITFDIGGMAGLAVSPEGNARKEYLWFSERKLSGHTAYLAFLVGSRKKTLAITFPETEANFYIVYRSDADLVTALLILSNYQPIPSNR